MRKFTIFILLFSIVSSISSSVRAQNTDIELLMSINGNPSVTLRDYSAFVSNTTKITAVSVPVIMGAVALIEKNDDLLKDAIYIGVSAGVSIAFSYGLKYSINRERPYDTYPGLLDVPYPETSASFPSAHTSTAFSIATALTLKYPKWYVVAPGYLWACSVGYSRMNLGVHYPSDVLAGAVLGAGSAFLTYKANEWFWKKHENKKLIPLQGWR